MTLLLRLLGGTKKSDREAYQMKEVEVKKDSAKSRHVSHKTTNQRPGGLIEVIVLHNVTKGQFLTITSIAHRSNSQK